MADPPASIGSPPLGIPPQGIPPTDPKYRDLAARGQLPRDVFNVLSYGASGDGNIDDTAALQRAVDAANKKGGGTVYLPRGTYRVTSMVTLYGGVAVVGEGHESLISWEGSDDVVTDWRRPLFFVSGSIGTYKNLTVTAAELATSLSVAAGDEAIVVAGDFVHVKSNEVWDTQDQGKRVGEIQRVASVSSGVINLTDRLFDGYATGDTARVAKITFVENVTLANLRIQGDMDGAEPDQAGARFILCRNVTIDNVSSQNIGNYHFGFDLCLDVGVSNVSTNRASTTTQGYGATFGGCQFVTITGCRFYGGRHAISNGAPVVMDGDTADTGVGGVNRCFSIVGNTVWDATSTGIGSHANAEYFTVVGNVITGGGSFGIGTTGANWVVEDNIIRAAPGGISLANKTDDRICAFVVRGNKVENSSSTPIVVQPVASASTKNRAWVVSGNSIIGASSGTAIQVGDTAGSSAVDGATVTGNCIWISGAEGPGIRCDYVDGLVVQGNSVYHSGTQTIPLYRLDNIGQFTFVGNVAYAGSTGTETVDCNNVDEGAVTGNTFYRGTHGINFDANSTNCSIVGNNFNGFGTAYISNAGSGMKVAHNVGTTVHVA